MILEDLMQMDSRQLHRVLCEGHPLDLARLAGRQYLGVDLSLPEWARQLLWHTFRKTFVSDGPGEVRGWNVKMEQYGVRGPQVPKRTAHGRQLTFGHYRVRETGGLRFPKGWRGAHYLDYGSAGNPMTDPARLGCTPLVAVNAGSQDLLLGWEVFRVGPAFLPFPLYWALEVQGAVDAVVPRPG